MVWQHFLIVFAMTQPQFGYYWDDWTLSHNADDCDFLLGHIASARMDASGTNNCTEINSFYVIQSEAVIYAVDYANANILNPHGIKIGVVGFDACDNTQIAYQKGIKFIEGKDTRLCQPNMPNETVITRELPLPTCNLDVKPQVHLVTGGITSDMSKGLCSLFEYFCIPLISTYSSNDKLSNGSLNPYFVRTIPPNRELAKVLVDLLQLYNWTSVYIVYDDTEYGRDIWNDFTLLSNGTDICIRDSQSLSDNFNLWDKGKMKKLLNKWHNQTEILLLLADYMSATEFMKLLAEADLKFQIVGSDGYSSMNYVAKNVETTVENTITVEPILRENPEFQEYLRNVTFNSTDSPWMKALIAIHNNCTNDSYANLQYSNTCAGNAKLNMNEVELMAIWRSHFAIEAVFLYAKAIVQIYTDHCKTDPYCQTTFKTKTINGKRLLDTILQTKLNESWAKFQFSNRDGPPDFSVMQYWFNREVGKYEWHTVGESINGSIQLNVSIDKAHLQEMDRKISICRRSCASNEFVTLSHDKCCTECQKCQSNQYVESNECRVCEGYVTEAGTCATAPAIAFYNHDSYYIALFVLSLTGLFLSLLLSGVFILKRNTPIVNAQMGKLGLLLPFSIACLFLTSILSLSCQASEPSCLANAYLLVFSLTVAFCVVCAKVINLATINNIDRPDQFPYRYFSSDKEKMTRTTLIISLSCFHLIFAIWVSFTTDFPFETLPEKLTGRYYSVCSVLSCPLSLINLFPLVILLITTTIFAYRGRNSIVLLHRLEAKQSFLTSIGVILSLGFLIPLQFCTDDVDMRGIAITVKPFVPALVFLLIFLIPNGYIPLCRPEKNTVDYVNQKVSQYKRKGNGGIFILTLESLEDRKRKSSEMDMLENEITPETINDPPVSSSTDK